MNKHILAATRWLIAAAVAVSGFIIRNADKIVTVAKVVHKWALEAAAKQAQQQVLKAHATYVAQDNAANAAAKAATAAYRRFHEAANKRDSVHVAVKAELELLA